jgi:hypothetical protein
MPKVLRAPGEGWTDLVLALVVVTAAFVAITLFVLSTKG